MIKLNVINPSMTNVNTRRSSKSSAYSKTLYLEARYTYEII
jgi:hypothetical protein